MVSGLYYADFISLYSPTQLCGGGTTKSNSNELPISVPLSLLLFEKNLGNSEKNILYLLPSPHTLTLKLLDKFLEFGISFWCCSMKLAEHV